MLIPSSTTQIIETGMERQLHLGMQIAVSLNGHLQTKAFGNAHPERPLTSNTPIPWLSAGKPITAVALAILVDQQKLAFHDRVVTHIPEFAQAGKETITVTHLLTHTAGLSPVDVDWSTTPWPEIIDHICRQPLRPGWTIGFDAGYDPAASWFILGEIIQRVSGRDLNEFLQTEIIDPIGMFHTSAQGTGEVDFAPLYDRVTGELRLSPYTPRLARKHLAPGSSLRGPASDLARFYQHLLGILNGLPGVIQQATLEYMLLRHRRDRFDQTQQHKLDYGLGFILDSNQYGAETVPYGFGRHASEKAFGHGGSQSSIGFADPTKQLAVAIIANGRAGEGQHQRRFRELLTGLYDDLGLA